MTPHFGLLPAVFGSTFKVACESPVAGKIPLASTTEATQADLKLIPIPARAPHALSENACCMAMFLKFQVLFSDVIALSSELLQF